MNKLGLIGKKLGHSGSPAIFKTFFEKEGLTDWSYALYELKDIRKIVDLCKDKELRGFNVTVPFKEAILPYLDAISEEAEFVGAVNTVKVVNGELFGYNTDVYGFEKMFWMHDLSPENCLVLGTGGASKAVQFVLRKREIKFELVSRTIHPDNISYTDLDLPLFKEFDCIINATPLGMFPEVETLPMLPYEGFNKEHTAIDLVYNPECTLFLGLAGANGSTIINGSQMLQFQAEKAWEIFKGSYTT